MLQHSFRRKLGDGRWREFVVTYCDDTPEREEAVTFFRRVNHRLVQRLTIPREVESMSEREGQHYLDEHPQPREWDILFVGREDDCTNQDLDRLQYIPELRILRIMSDRITDAGVACLKRLHAPEVLVLHSRTVSTACLDDIVQLRTLTSLDLQGSSKIALTAFEATVRRMPALVDVYAPRE